MFHAYQINRSQEDSNKKLLLDLENSNLANKELREKIEVGRHSKDSRHVGCHMLTRVILGMLSCR